MKNNAKPQIHYRAGIFIGLVVIFCWFLLLVFSLSFKVNFYNPLTYLLILVQTHLYTGLFITAHDAMHGAVSGNKNVNNFFGYCCCFLFAFNWFPRLKKKHFLHHNYVAGSEDPDFYKGNFFSWYFSFLKNYITLIQFVLMGACFNFLMLFYPKINVILFWMIPAMLSTLQLFYFGTYLPHKGNHAEENIHKSRSQPKNHFIAFISCYFFGYHYEHHDAPSIPWWQLYKIKNKK